MEFSVGKPTNWPKKIAVTTSRVDLIESDSSLMDSIALRVPKIYLHCPDSVL